MEVNGAPELLCFPHSSEYLPLYSAEQRHSYRFGTTWGWANDDIIFSFGWNYPFKYIPSCSSNHSMISERVICLLLSNKVVCYFLNHRWYTSEYTQKHLTTSLSKNILKQFTSKWKFCYHLLAIMLFQTHKCFVCNTKEDVNETWEISVAPLKVHTTQTLMLQKVHKIY